MVPWRAAKRPERILQPLGQGYEALASKHHMGMLEAGEGEAKVIEPVRQRLARDGDAKGVGVGEVRQAHGAWFMLLAEDDLLLRPMQRPPRPDAALEGAADVGVDLGMATTQLLEDADAADARRRLQDRDDLLLPPGRKRIGPPPLSRVLLLRGQAWIALDPISARGGKPRPGGGGLEVQCLAEGHVKPHLVVGDMEAGHLSLPPLVEMKATAWPNPTQPPDGSKTRAGQAGPPLGLRPPVDPARPALSHPDCRVILIVIVAGHL